MKNAQWIWGGADPRTMNSYRLFRREFFIDKMPDRADLWCFAESRYKLYINGRFVQVGPTLCQPSHRLIDRHDVREFLKEGQNCIGFIVYCPGIMTGQWTLVNPGLIAAANFDNSAPPIVTDSSWQTITGDAWRRPTQLCGYAKGFHEWHVVDEMPVGWNGPGFIASSWERAVALPFLAYGRPEYLNENYVGYPTLHEHLPVSAAHIGLAGGKVTEEMKSNAESHYTAVRNRWRKMMGLWHMYDINTPLPDAEPLPPPIAELSHSEEHFAISPNAVKSARDGNSLPVVLYASDDGHPFVTFDFGQVQSGLLSVEIESETGGMVDIGWDDRVRQDGSVAVFRSTPNCDRVEVPAGHHRWEGLFDRGLRYMQVIMRGFKGRIILHKVGALETLTPIDPERQAEFESGDDLLNRIWKAAVHTTRQYMTGCGAGDPIRERCHWFHDDTMAMRMAFYCYGDWRTWRRALELTAQSQNSDGSFPVISPGHFEDFNMLTGSCYWALQVAEYRAHTGDSAFSRKMMPHIEALIDYESRFAGPEGLLYETPGRRFLSWADGDPRPPYKPGETWGKTSRRSWGDFFDPPTCGYNAIINTYWLWMLREASALAAVLRMDEASHRWQKVFDTARAAFDTMFWDQDVGLYRDNVAFDKQGNTKPAAFCESTLFILMRAGLLSAEKGLQCLDRIMDSSFFCCRTSGGLDLGALPVFLIESGRTGEALDYYRDRWGAPIEAGATTCGEEFFQSGQNSDCHIHGATPARDFLEYVAGIRILSPWWRDVLLVPPKDSPRLPELRAIVPTPQGNITVEILKRNNGKVYKYKLPEGCRGYAKRCGETFTCDSSGEFALVPE